MSLSKNLRLEVILQGIDRLTKPLKGVLGASQGAAREVKALRDRLKELDRGQKMLGEFGDVSRGLAVTKHQLGTARDKVATLREQIAQTPAPTKQMAAAMKAAETEAAALGMRHGKLVAQQLRLRESLTAAGFGTTGLTAQQRALKAQSDQVSHSLSVQVGRLQQLNRRQQQMHAARAQYEKGMRLRNQLAGTGAGMVAAGAATGVAVAAPIKAYADAEDAGTQLKVAMMTKGAQVGPEFARINALATQLGNRLPGTTADFQNMMTMLIRQGMSATAILGGLGEATAYLGVQLKLPVTEAAEFASKLQDATRTSERDMMSLMDVIQKTFYLGVDHNNMLQAFAKLSPAMDTIKQKGLEGARALAPLIVLADQAGMAGESAGNAYRKVFQAALDKDKIAKANAALKGQGITLDFTNGKGEFGGLEKLFAQLTKLRGLTTQTRQGVIKSIFGDDAETLQVVSLLIDKGAAGYAEVQGKMARQASLQERVNQQLGTLKNLWDAATGTFTNALVAFGEAIAPELKQLTQWINDVSEATGKWAKEHPQLAGFLMKSAAIIAVVLTVLGSLTLALAAVLGPMAVVRYGFAMLGINAGSVLGALRLVGQAVLWIGRALLMNPIGLAIAGIALAAYLIYRYWEPIKGFFQGLWGEVRAAFTGGIGGIAALILNWSPLGLFYKAFAAVLGWFGIELPGKFSEFGANLLAGLVRGITGALGTVKAAIGGAADAVVGWFKEKLGIHSPSRVFAELGGFTMAGLDQGLTAGQRQPLGTLSDFTRRLTAVGAGVAIAGSAAAGVGLDTRPPLGAPRGATAPTAGGNTYVFQIYPAPGMDEKALARLVLQKIEETERGKAVRSRTRLADKD